MTEQVTEQIITEQTAEQAAEQQQFDMELANKITDEAIAVLGKGEKFNIVFLALARMVTTFSVDFLLATEEDGVSEEKLVAAIKKFGEYAEAEGVQIFRGFVEQQKALQAEQEAAAAETTEEAPAADDSKE